MTTLRDSPVVKHVVGQDNMDKALVASGYGFLVPNKTEQNKIRGMYQLNKSSSPFMVAKKDELGRYSLNPNDAMLFKSGEIEEDRPIWVGHSVKPTVINLTKPSGEEVVLMVSPTGGHPPGYFLLKEKEPLMTEKNTALSSDVRGEGRDKKIYIIIGLLIVIGVLSWYAYACKTKMEEAGIRGSKPIWPNKFSDWLNNKNRYEQAV